MKVYVASRFENKEEVRRVYSLLVEKGYSITADWTIHKRVQPVTDITRVLATEYALEDIEGVIDCDVFIFLTMEKSGTGSTTEFGAALLSQIVRHKPKVYVVGHYIEQNLFFIHPSVILKQTIEDVIEELQ